MFLTKIRKFFAQCQEMIKKLNRFSDIPNGKSSTECWERLAKCANKTSQNHPMPTSKAVFTTLPKSFRQRAESLPLTCENGKNTYNSFKKLVFFQGFRWTCGILYWQSCWSSFNKNLKKVAQKTKITKKYTFFPIKTPLKYSSGHVGYNFYNRTHFACRPKWTGKSFFFQYFLLKFIYLEVKCTFLDRPKNACRKAQFFSCQSPQKYWKLT